MKSHERERERTTRGGDRLSGAREIAGVGTRVRPFGDDGVAVLERPVGADDRVRGRLLERLAEFAERRETLHDALRCHCHHVVGEHARGEVEVVLADPPVVRVTERA